MHVPKPGYQELAVRIHHDRVRWEAETRTGSNGCDAVPSHKYRDVGSRGRASAVDHRRMRQGQDIRFRRLGRLNEQQPQQCDEKP